jgi:hypothetical protein
LLSITLGLLTVLVATFRSLPLRRRQDNASNAHLSLAFAHVGMARAGPYHQEVQARACPRQQLQKMTVGGGVLPYLPFE